MAMAEYSQRKSWPRRKLILLIGGLVALGLVATAAPVLILIFVAQPIRVQGVGMAPNLNDGDRVFISKRPGQIRRGDVIVFYFPQDPSKGSYIKRVIGLPGEEVEIRGGTTYINGSLLDEPYSDPQSSVVLFDLPPLRVPDDNYFVMGDNRDNSSDSRSWGPVPRSLIYGKVIGRYWAAGE